MLLEKLGGLDTQNEEYLQLLNPGEVLGDKKWQKTSPKDLSKEFSKEYKKANDKDQLINKINGEIKSLLSAAIMTGDARYIQGAVYRLDKIVSFTPKKNSNYLPLWNKDDYKISEIEKIFFNGFDHEWRFSCQRYIVLSQDKMSLEYKRLKWLFANPIEVFKTTVHSDSKVITRSEAEIILSTIKEYKGVKKLREFLETNDLNNALKKYKVVQAINYLMSIQFIERSKDTVQKLTFYPKEITNKKEKEKETEKEKEKITKSNKLKNLRKIPNSEIKNCNDCVHRKVERKVEDSPRSLKWLDLAGCQRKVGVKIEVNIINKNKKDDARSNDKDLPCRQDRLKLISKLQFPADFRSEEKCFSPIPTPRFKNMNNVKKLKETKKSQRVQVTPNEKKKKIITRQPAYRLKSSHRKIYKERPKTYQDCEKFYLKLFKNREIAEKVVEALAKEGYPLRLTTIIFTLKTRGEGTRGKICSHQLVNILNTLYDERPDLFDITKTSWYI